MLEIKSMAYDDAELAADIIRKSFAEQARILGISQKEYPAYVVYETAERVRERVDAGEHIFMAYSDGRTVGSIRYAVDTNNSKIGYINRLAVIPEFRGNGYGRILMEYAENKLLEHGVNEVIISIVKQFSRLENYYTGLGYKFLKDQNFQSLPFEVRFMTKSIQTNKPA